MATIRAGALGLMVATAAVVPAAETVLEVGSFSTAAPGTEYPDNWRPLTFKKIPRHTLYSLVRDGETVVLKADSEAGASALVRQIAIDPRAYPILRWRWKIRNPIEKSDMSRKAGDDYPARLYITFQYDRSQLGLFEIAKFEAMRLLYGDYPPVAALNYVWAGHEAKETIAPNAYAARARMIVVENRDSETNVWLSEERNILEDYRRAFGRTEAIPMISGVAVMTDTDDTRGVAVSYFGDILFVSR